jgi:hypothetical protein
MGGLFHYMCFLTFFDIVVKMAINSSDSFKRMFQTEETVGLEFATLPVSVSAVQQTVGS